MVIPLGEPIVDRYGKTISSVTVGKGTTLFVRTSLQAEPAVLLSRAAILNINQSTDIWGPDAAEFNPDRYSKPALEQTNQVPGVWGNLLTFLGGTRNCIGYRFALVEIKVILFVLLRSFEFQELASKPEIEKKAS